MNGVIIGGLRKKFPVLRHVSVCVGLFTLFLAPRTQNLYLALNRSVTPGRLFNTCYLNLTLKKSNQNIFSNLKDGENVTAVVIKTFIECHYTE